MEFEEGELSGMAKVERKREKIQRRGVLQCYSLKPPLTDRLTY